MIIYKVTNTIDGKVYIGQTVQRLKERWQDHCRGDKDDQSYLHRAIQKHGRENFVVEKLDSSETLIGLNVLEEYYIKRYDSLAPNGYNLLPGGENRRCHEDTRAKLSLALKGRPITNRWDKGFVGQHTQETKDKISAALKGKPIAHRWDKGNSAPRSDETKAKISAAIKGKPQPSKYKAVLVVETGQVYPSVSGAAQAMGIARTEMSSYLSSGKRNKRTGFTFQYAVADAKKKAA